MKNWPFIWKLLLVSLISVVPQYALEDASLVTLVSGLAGWFLCKSPREAVWLGGLGAGLPWLVLAFWLDMGNEHILSRRMAELFHLPGYGFILLTTFVLAFVMGLVASLTGYYFQQFVQTK